MGLARAAACTRAPAPPRGGEGGEEKAASGPGPLPPLAVLYIGGYPPASGGACQVEPAMALGQELTALARAGEGPPLLVVCGCGEGFGRSPHMVLEMLLKG